MSAKQKPLSDRASSRRARDNAPERAARVIAAIGVVEHPVGHDHLGQRARVRAAAAQPGAVGRGEHDLVIAGERRSHRGRPVMVASPAYTSALTPRTGAWSG